MTISPTFALQAHTLIEKGRVEEAIALCERGLEVYPDYATAYSILAQAYERMENNGRAADVLERGIRRLPLERSLLRMKTVKGTTHRRDLSPLPSNETEKADAATAPAFVLSTRMQEQDILADQTSGAIPAEQSAAGETELSAIEWDIEPEESAMHESGIREYDIQKYRQELNVEQTESDKPGPEEEPEIEVPEPQKPEIGEPEQEPGIELPELEKPEIQEPEKKPEIELPEPQKPEIELPEPDKPEVQEPEIGEPEQEPGIELPEPGKPEVQEPEKKPEIELPEPQKPEIQEPEPEIELPEPEQTEIELPDPGQNDGQHTPVGSITKPMNGNGIVHSLSPRSNGSEHSAAGAPSPRHSHLRIIESADTTEMPSLIWRSKNVRLIPGLEFTPLRFESKKDKLYRPAYRIPDPPPFPEFEVTKKKPIRFQQRPDDSRTALTPLEELARRLEAARIPRVEEEEAHPLPPPVAPRAEQSSPMITETMAKIYEMQGAISEAVKAYEALARQKPDMAEQYTKKVRELKNKM